MFDNIRDNLFFCPRIFCFESGLFFLFVLFLNHRNLTTKSLICNVQKNFSSNLDATEPFEGQRIMRDSLVLISFVGNF